MRCRRLLVLLLCFLATLSSVTTAFAQYYVPAAMPGYSPGALPPSASAMGGGYMPEIDMSQLAYMSAGQTMAYPPQAMPYGMPPGMGGYGAMPAAFQEPMDMQGPMMADGGHDGECCPDCGHRRGRDLLDFILPHGEGGICAPRWFDFYAEAVRFKREDVSRRVDFSSDGVGGPIVLSSDSLNFNQPYGFRAVAAIQTTAGSNIEFNYLGALNQQASATVLSNNNLYSVLSDYGTNPGPPNFGFDETDAAFRHSIAYSSAFNSFDLGHRRRWQGPDCRLQGSWIAGVRHVQFNEEFIHRTRTTQNAGNGALDYLVATNNSLTGFQFGGDAWLTVIPGLRLGAELKGGIYGNHAHQYTDFTATLGNATTAALQEKIGRNSVAFLGEAALNATYRINYNWTLRAGYTLIFIDGVGLAIENFNTGAPFVNGRPRTPFFNDNGDVFLHGGTLGLEYIW